MAVTFNHILIYILYPSVCRWPDVNLRPHMSERVDWILCFIFWRRVKARGWAKGSRCLRILTSAKPNNIRAELNNIVSLQKWGLLLMETRSEMFIIITRGLKRQGFRNKGNLVFSFCHNIREFPTWWGVLAHFHSSSRCWRWAEIEALPDSFFFCFFTLINKANSPSLSLQVQQTQTQLTGLIIGRYGNDINCSNTLKTHQISVGNEIVHDIYTDMDRVGKVLGMNPIEPEFKDIWKSMCKRLGESILPKFYWSISEWYSVVCMHAWQDWGMLLMSQQMVSWNLPDLDQAITELLYSLWCNLAVSDRPKLNVPEVVYWI